MLSVERANKIVCASIDLKSILISCKLNFAQQFLPVYADHIVSNPLHLSRVVRAETRRTSFSLLLHGLRAHFTLPSRYD